MFKLTYILYPRPDLDRNEARRRWMEDHGALMLKYADSLRVVRYIQTPHVANPWEEVMASARGVECRSPLGMAEIYWSSANDFEFSFKDSAGRRAYKELLEDEKRFAIATLSPWVGVERNVIGEGAGA